MVPALPNVPGVMRVTVRQTLDDDIDVINRQFFGYSGTVSLADANTLAADVLSGWAAHVLPHLSSRLKAVEAEVVDLASSSGAVGVSVSTSSGGDTSGMTAAGAAFVVRLKVARRYRGGHPRQYLCGVSVDALNNGQDLTSAFATALATGYAGYSNGLVAASPTGVGTMRAVNVSYYQGFVNHTFPSGRVRPIPVLRGSPIVDNIIGFEVNPKVASQRRRNTQA